MSQKRCNKCGVTKDLSEFYAMGHGKNGVKGHCRECEKEYRQSRKKEPLPKEGEEYVVNSNTMRNHFYLHFGFTERIYMPSEYAKATKYSIYPIKPNRRNAK